LLRIVLPDVRTAELEADDALEVQIVWDEAVAEPRCQEKTCQEKKCPGFWLNLESAKVVWWVVLSSCNG
jgi:hypothetical protein